jgi:glycosyltransferase involved in cell wall biosynthesis
MRIALFTETFLPSRDGVVTRLTHTIEALSQRGDDVLIVAPHIHGLPKDYQGVPVLSLPCIPFPLYRGFYLGSPVLSKNAQTALRRFQPEVVHIVNPVAIGLAGLRYARHHMIPLVASYHTNIPEYTRRYGFSWAERPTRWYLRQIHNRAQLNLCTSRSVQIQLQSQGIRHVELWEPGIDVNLFNPARRSEAWRSRLTEDHSEKTILLYVGRLAPEKELEHILAALPALTDCHMAFVGDGPEAESLRQAAKGLPVTFVGTLDGEELAAAYASADIFVFPSSTETLGLVAIEAMASGLPVVGARRGGLLDIIVDVETGLFFEPGSSIDFAHALSYLANNREERVAMARAARQRALQWSWSASTEGLRQKYALLLDKMQN